MHKYFGDIPIIKPSNNFKNKNKIKTEKKLARLYPFNYTY